MKYWKSKLDAISKRKHNNKSAGQSIIEVAYSCLDKTILQTAERTIPETKKRQPVAWWNKECEREKRKARAKYRNTTKLRLFLCRRAIKQSFQES